MMGVRKFLRKVGLFLFLAVSVNLSSIVWAESVIKLKAAHTFPPASKVPQTLMAYAERVEKETNGQVTITVHGPGLIKLEEFVEATATGVVDMAYGTINLDLARFGLETALNLPGLPWNRPYPEYIDTEIKIIDELRKRFPVIDEKRKDVIVLYEVIHPPFVFHSPKKKVRVPSEMTGMKIAASGLFITMTKVLGAAPVSIAAPDRYMALQRGVIDGSFDVYGGIYAMKLYEVTNNYLEAGFGESMGVVVMNRKKFESLSPEIRNVFIKNRIFAVHYAAKGLVEETKLCKDAIQKRGGTIIVPNESERALWQEKFKLVKDEWVKEIEARGFPARDFLRELEGLIRQHGG